MKIWPKLPPLEKINQKSLNTLVGHLDITIDQLGDDYLEGSMPVNEKTIQPYGILHGGASCVLAESLGSIASNLLVQNDGKIAVGQHISTHHLKPASSGRVIGKATLVHQGKKSHVWNIDISDDKNRRISSTRLTMAIIEKQESSN